MDETGYFTTQNPTKVIALKGAKQVGAVSFAERGILVAMVGTINAQSKTQSLLFLFSTGPLCERIYASRSAIVF